MINVSLRWDEQDEKFANSPKHKLRKIFKTQFLVINWFQKGGQEITNYSKWEQNTESKYQACIFFLNHCLTFG